MGDRTRLSIIGEAMVRLRSIEPEIASAISDAPDIIRFRNKLIHEYPEIDDSKVWDIVRNEIPLLLAEIRVLLPRHIAAARPRVILSRIAEADDPFDAEAKGTMTAMEALP